jgi:nucleoside-diphosphate-sugar epimerase
MKLTSSQAWQDDLASTADPVPEEAVRSGTYLVTGASGLIGSAFVDLLLQLRRSRSADIRVVAAGRDVSKLKARFADAEGLDFISYDATRPFSYQGRVDYVVHAASNASPELYIADPCGTLSANIDGVRNLLEFARNTHVRKLLYVSSSEVYGVRTGPGPTPEADYGRVNPLDTRSSYAEGKRAAEAICAAYASQHGVDVSIVRPGHIYGPTATASDHRVSSEFPRLAARGEPIVLKSAGTQRRSYCHCLDCATAILVALAKGKRATAYNISNPGSVITIREMAELVAEAGAVPISCADPTAAEKAAFNPMDDSSLDATSLLALGWQPAFGARDGLARTVAAIREVSPQ